MEKDIYVGRKKLTIQENVVDRFADFVSPSWGLRRLRNRVQAAYASAYVGGSRSRRSMSGFNPLGNSADSDLLRDLPTLRARSRDLVRNTPIATGAVNTVVTSVVGPGLRCKPTIDRMVLGLDEKAADEWERTTQRRWKLWSGTQECDATRTQTFAEYQGMVFRSALESGDIFILLPVIKLRGSQFGMRLQAIEADRVENESFKRDTADLAGGVELDEHGAPHRYHILKKHPGDNFGKSREWQKLLAFGPRSGRRNVLHLYDKLRPGQTRGAVFLAPVIEAIKQLGDYCDNEAAAAVAAGMFTVFIETEDGGTGIDVTNTSDETGATTSDDDIKMGNAAIVGLAPGEKINTASPGRPNDAFDPFILAFSRWIGAALEIPFELLIKHFSSSYSASRASLLEAWRFFRRRRSWLVNGFCQPVYEAFITEQVAHGHIDAPGFFDDPIIRQAYLGTTWLGLPQGHIQPLQEANAMKVRTEIGVTTLAQEAAEYSGADWEVIHQQSTKEKKARLNDGLTEAINMTVPKEQKTLEDLKDNE